MNSIKRRRIKRAAWGSNRTFVRQKLAKHRYDDIDPDDFRVHDDWYSYSWPTDDRIRYWLTEHPGRFKKQKDLVCCYIGCLKGDISKFNRRFGLDLPMCIKCHGATRRLHWDETDEETYGLCWNCAGPIMAERARKAEAELNLRSLSLAQKLLPTNIIHEIQSVGWFDKSVLVCLPPGPAAPFGKTVSITYRITDRGEVYNVDGRHIYCIHATQTVARWDHIIMWWYLLKDRPEVIEEKGQKHPPMSLHRWKEFWARRRLRKCAQT